MEPNQKPTLHLVSDVVANSQWVANFAGEGIAELEAHLAKYAQFDAFCAERDEAA